MLHEFGDGVLAIADTFLEDGSDEGGSFGLVETETAGETFLSKRAGVVEEELVAFAG